MIKHIQKSTKSKGFWQPTFAEMILQPTVYYWKNIVILVPLTVLSSLHEGDIIYIENDPDPLHLIKAHSINDYSPLAKDASLSPGPVFWFESGDLHYIYHEVNLK